MKSSGFYVCVCGCGGFAWWVRVSAHTHRFSMKTNGFCVCVCMCVCVCECVCIPTSFYEDKCVLFEDKCVLCVRKSTPTVLRSICSEAHPKGSTQKFTLTPWCRVLLEKLTGLQLVKKFPALHGTRRFITALTSVRHLSLSWASPIQSMYPHPIS